MKIAMMLRGFISTPVQNDIAYSPATVAQSIVEGLHNSGHEITFFGPEGTQLPCQVETCGIRPLFTTMSEFDALVGSTDLFTDYMFSLIDQKMARTMLERAKDGEFDCVVFHHFESAIALAPLFPTVPIVYVLHDAMDERYRQMLELHSSPNQYFISISDSQRRSVPDLNYAATIYNGIDIDAFEFSSKAGEYLMFSGRITADKGVKEAVQIALHSKMRLLIAGNLSKQDYWYFDEHIKPYLDDKILFLGMLQRTQLVKYYQKAKAVLMPIQWEEPFGLSMIEANACGAPILAFRRGSVPEVVKDGKTGFIVDNSAEMILAIEKLKSIKRKDCHEHAKKNFSRELMVENYEKALAEIIARHGGGKRRKKISDYTAKDISKRLTKLSKKNR